MADGIQILSNAAAIARRFEDLPSKVQSAGRKGFARGLLLLEEEVKRRADLRFSGSRSGLASRLTSLVEVGSGAIAIDGQIGFRRTRGFPYELAQEYGAQARSGGAMAIPISKEAKRLGEQGVSAKDFPRTIFRPGNSHVLAEAKARGSITVHYVLVKSIRPRLHFRDTVEDNLGMVADHFVRAVQEAL